jgi:hypothetical protein
MQSYVTQQAFHGQQKIPAKKKTQIVDYNLSFEGPLIISSSPDKLAQVVFPQQKRTASKTKLNQNFNMT